LRPEETIEAARAASPRLACVLLNYKNEGDTIACVRALQGEGADALKIFLVNNHAVDGSGPRLEAFLASTGIAHRHIDPGFNSGFAGGCNIGIRAALEEGFTHVLVLNNDAEAEPGFLPALLREIEAHPDDVLAGRVTDLEGRPTFNVGRISPLTGRPVHDLSPTPREPIDFVSGCLMVAPRAALEKAGLFDEKLFMYAEDLDLCLRFRRAGIRVRYRPAFGVRHGVSATVRKTGFPAEYYVQRNQAYVVLRRGSAIQRLVYAFFIPAMLLRKALTRPEVFTQALRGARDGILGRMGMRHASG
jgi:GT2 family glycosyltransferase